MRIVPLVLAFVAAPVAAQLQTPPDWRYALDEPARLVVESAVPDSAWRFVAMPPGWHVTTGPGARLYRPGHAADGHFSLETTVYLFPDPSDAGFGLFLGAEVDDAGVPREQVAFLLRRDGLASVTRHDPDGPAPLVPWVRADSAAAHEGGVVKYRLGVTADPHEVSFRVNDHPVATLARAVAPVDGVFGLRVGPGLNVHVGALDLTHHLAPVPPPEAPDGGGP